MLSPPLKEEEDDDEEEEEGVKRGEGESVAPPKASKSD